MDIPTIPGAVYSIASSSSCDVTDKASGKPLGTATPGSPVTTPAYSDALTLSDPDALYVQIKTFNFALAALGLLGGGESVAPDVLPAGYLAAEFLITGVRGHVDTGLAPNSGFSFELSFKKMSYNNSVFFTYFGNNENCVQIHDISGALRIVLGGVANILADKEYVPNKVRSVVTVKDKQVSINNGTPYALNSGTAESQNVSGFPFGVLSNNYLNGANSAIFYAKLNDGRGNKRFFIPALDPKGVACLYDKETKNAFYNVSDSSVFGVGLTIEQALKLSALPATGGTLTISLPEGYDTDPAVTDAIATATAKGWNITIQTYTAESAASSSSFALRRIWVRQTPSVFGPYVDASGNRFTVEWCVAMSNTDGSEPDSHGYELFRSVDAAVDSWQLTPYIDPETQKLLTETNENE